jgi:hypothetical protein
MPPFDAFGPTTALRLLPLMAKAFGRKRPLKERHETNGTSAQWGVPNRPFPGGRGGKERAARNERSSDWPRGAEPPAPARIKAANLSCRAGGRRARRGVHRPTS